jgi:hypothetical protein
MITEIASPKFLTPAHNNMYYYFDSSSKTELGFRYIVNVIDYQTSEIIGTYKLKPIPTSLYGEVDIAKVINSTLYPDFQIAITNYTAQGHLLHYYLEVNEEYFVTTSFTDYGYAGSGWANYTNPIVNPNGFSRTMLIQSTLPPYVAGDVILVTQTPSANYRAELEGVHTVLDVFLSLGIYYTVLDLNWIGSGLASAGESSYADGQKSIIPGIITHLQYAFNGAFGFVPFQSYSHTSYILGGSGKQFITTLSTKIQPRISRMIPTFFQVFNQTADTLYLVFNLDGSFYRYPFTCNGVIEQINVLPSDSNLVEFYSGAWVAFAGGLDMTNIDTYTIQVKDVIDTPLSQLFNITLYSEEDCHTTYDLTFMDRLGSWITLPFYKGSYMNQDVSKENIRTKFGELSEGAWGYKSQDRGLTTYSVEETITYTVNSQHLTEGEAQYYKELLSSPSVFCSINGSEPQAINITTASMPLHLARTKKDRICSIMFQMATQDEING